MKKNTKKAYGKTLFLSVLTIALFGSAFYVSVFMTKAESTGTIIKKNDTDFAGGIFNGTNVFGFGDEASIRLGKDIEGGLNQNYQSDILDEEGLVSYWTMDNGFEDAGSNGYHFPMSPSAPEFLESGGAGNGNLGGAVQFSSGKWLKDSGGDVSQFHNSNVSFDFWIKPVFGTEQVIFETGYGSHGFGLGITMDPNGYIKYRSDNFFTSTSPLQEGVWNHVVISVEAYVRGWIYINGQLASDNPSGYVGSTHAGTGISFGKTFSDNGVFLGALDEFKIYKRVLSQSDVDARYNNGNGQEGDPQEADLVAGWHFNEVAGDGKNKYADFSNSSHDLKSYIPNIVSGGKFNNSAYFNEDALNSPEGCFLDQGQFLSSSRTVEMWIKPRDESYEFEHPGAMVVDNGAAWGKWSIRELPKENAESSRFAYTGFSPWFGHFGEDLVTSIPNDEWHHFAAVQKTETFKSTIIHYLDGVKVAERTYDAHWYYDWFGGATHLCVGKSPYTGFPTRYSGGIDELAIYNRALDVSEINDHISDMYLSSGETEQLFNMNWNGGWGDGINNDSEAISIDISDATSEAKVIVQARIAESESGLDENLPYEDIQVRHVDDLQSQLSEIVSGGKHIVTKGDLENIFGPVDPNKRYIQIRVVLNSSQDQKTSPLINGISVTYQKDATEPEIGVSDIGIKRALNPENPLELIPVGFDDPEIQRGPDGKIWISYFNNFERGDKPYFVWNNAADNRSGIKGYCLYVGTDPNGDPETIYDPDDTTNGFSNMLRYNSPISLLDESGNPTKCQFIVPAMEGEKTLFDSARNENGDDAGYWEGNLYGTDYDESGNSVRRTYYLNIKAIDKENNIQEITDYTGSGAQLEINYDDYDPEKNVDYVSLPNGYVSSKAATMTWPTAGDEAARDDDNHNSGIVGYQYRIGLNGEWRGDHINGPEDYLGFDIIPSGSSSYTFSEVDFPDIKEGVNLVYFRVFDRAGNYLPRGDSRWDYGRVWGVLKYDPEAAAPPTNLTVNPPSSNQNAFEFSWSPPEVLPVGVSASDISYCYTVNTLPSEITCTFTGNGVTNTAIDSFATQPGENTFYVASRSQAGVTRYEDHISVKFSYTGEAPSFGLTNNIDIADISIKSTKNWKLAVSWDKPLFEGAGIAKYKVFRSEKEGLCSGNTTDFSVVGETAGTSYVDTGLQQKRYYYCVKACDNANNCGASSGTVSEFPTGKFTQPAKLVGGPEISSITTSKAKISWTTERESDSKVAYGEKRDDYFREEPSNSSQVTGHSIELNNLSPGTTYYFRAKWTDEDGNTGISAEKTFKTEPAPTVKDVKVRNIGISGGVIGFTTKGSSKAKVYYGNTTSFGSVKEISTSKEESDYTVILEGLSDDAKYYYKINTFDSEDKEYEGTVLDFTTMPRPRISNVKVEEIRGSAQPEVLVTWETNTETSSIVEYNPVGESGSPKDAVNLEMVKGEHRMNIVNLLPTMTYEMVVKGVDSIGNEAVSDKYTFTTSSDTRPPRILNVVVEGSNFKSGNKEGSQYSSQLVVSWETDEPATSQVEFGEGSGSIFKQKTSEDSNLKTNHLVVVSGLEPSKVYGLRAISKDKADNDSLSDHMVTITPKAADNAFDLVIGSLREIFGFFRN